MRRSCSAWHSRSARWSSRRAIYSLARMWCRIQCRLGRQAGQPPLPAPGQVQESTIGREQLLSLPVQGHWLRQVSAPSSLWPFPTSCWLALSSWLLPSQRVPEPLPADSLNSLPPRLCHLRGTVASAASRTAVAAAAAAVVAAAVAASAGTAAVVEAGRPVAGASSLDGLPPGSGLAGCWHPVRHRPKLPAGGPGPSSAGPAG
mmetsp:Transcript_70036/g.163890  ORF Transcript_70036/g.163890 Transcript_70036/m.163890 type:complete len:203 (-) Transcript_70036:360-968(-)